MSAINPQIEESWKSLLMPLFNTEKFAQLKEFLVEERKKQVVYPPGKLIFNAFNHTPVNEVKVVILGQDPYHGPGQAHGLSFSVPEGIGHPPSLRNIFKELKNEFQFEIPMSGNLERWSKQGVLLLNATLTVRAKSPGSHQGKGWEEFTDGVIETISNQLNDVVFLLWGRFAQSKEPLIDQNRHLVLKAAHPSPFSADRGFFGCQHFSKANAYLKKQGKEEIDWSLE